MSESYERVHPRSAEEWRAWLSEHADSSPGVWVVQWRTGHGPQVPYEDLVQQAVCFGWIDSTAKRLNDEKSMQLMTPRRPRSGWSASNKARVERLTAAGLMAPRGLAVVEAAKANGSWNLLDDVEALREPEDLAAALEADLQARTAWLGFPPSARRQLLWWVVQAKTQATRDRRIAVIVAEAHEGRRAGQ